ncbi:MAG: hypothetical protein D6715_02315 [Calditrichaeota bacterium]|nr:MAG: hypothetical protein D6715_02315 [Calditrichota bacterium]
MALLQQKNKRAALQKAFSQKPSRVVGSYSQGLAGPRIFVVAGIHGNEPAGVVALQRLFAQLESNRAPFYGQIIGLRGNIQALQENRRYLKADLNRLWRDEMIEKLPGQMMDADGQEWLELADLLDHLRALAEPQASQEPVVLVDLHSTSAPSCPFLIDCGDSRLAALFNRWPIPRVEGLDQVIQGTMIQYFMARGIASFAFEGGQHQDPLSAENHLALLWLLLSDLGCVPEAQQGRRGHYADQLKATVNCLHLRFRLKYRYRIQCGEAFRMEPGFSNFQPVSRGQVLARNQDGLIYCPMDGFIFMPLYQREGDDGFFIIQPVEEEGE